MYRFSMILRFGPSLAALLGLGSSIMQAAPTLYRLTPEGGYYHGCVAGPCACPVYGPIGLIGTFELELIHSNPLFDEYALTDIDWYVDLPEGLARFTGEGTYRVGGEVAIQQEIELTLIDEKGSRKQYRGDLGIGGNRFPIIDVQALATGEECVMSAFRVVAEPAPATVFRLGAKSTYRHGCIGGLCDCAVYGPDPAEGTFLLTQIETHPLYNRYALHGVRIGSLINGQRVELRGRGLYEIGGEVAVMQRLRLFLTALGEEGIDDLDSGFMPATVAFPAFDIETATHTNCFERVLWIQARPAGDFDLDGDVDAGDLAGWFQPCVTGPSIAQPIIFCAATDIDGDGDTDQADYGVMQRCVTGERGPVDAGCAE